MFASLEKNTQDVFSGIVCTSAHSVSKYLKQSTLYLQSRSFTVRSMVTRFRTYISACPVPSAHHKKTTYRRGKGLKTIYSCCECLNQVTFNTQIFWHCKLQVKKKKKVTSHTLSTPSQHQVLSNPELACAESGAGLCRVRSWLVRSPELACAESGAGLCGVRS